MPIKQNTHESKAARRLGVVVMMFKSQRKKTHDRGAGDNTQKPSIPSTYPGLAICPPSWHTCSYSSVKPINQCSEFFKGGCLFNKS
jgi:hypothetical protein